MTVVEHNGKGVLILNAYPWRVELTAGELLALAALAPDVDACHAASVMAGRAVDRLSAVLLIVARTPLAERLRLVDQCISVADRLGPAGWPDEPAMVRRDNPAAAY